MSELEKLSTIVKEQAVPVVPTTETQQPETQTQDVAVQEMMNTLR